MGTEETSSQNDPTTDLSSEQPTFWQSRYQDRRTPWDLGTVAPPFVSFYTRNQQTLVPGKMAVLGSGYGHDAAFFAQQGFDVTGFDYVAEAVSEARSRYGQWARFEQADIFQLDPQLYGTFDYVLEHTCFCAIPPHQRPAYVDVVHHLLKPHGYFIGLIWADVDEDGPPYPSTTEALRTQFSPFFRIDRIEVPQDSVEDRQRQELFCVFQRTDTLPLSVLTTQV